MSLEMECRNVEVSRCRGVGASDNSGVEGARRLVGFGRDG
jgi:hypothetical protein